MSMRRVLIHDAVRGASALLVPAFVYFSRYLSDFLRLVFLWLPSLSQFISRSPILVSSSPAESRLRETQRPARGQPLRIGLLRGLAASIAMLSMFANESVFAAVTFRGAASAASTGSTIAYGGDGAAATRNTCGSITPALPASTAAGDLLIALVSAGAQPALAMAGWTQLFQASGAANETAAIYWRIATGGDPNTIAQSGSCNSLIGRISRFTGVDTAQPFQTAPLAAGNYSYQNAATVTSGSVTTTFPGAMLVFTAHSTDDDTFGALGGFAQAYNSITTTGNDTAIALYYAQQAAPGVAGPYSVTKNRGSDPNHGTVFALRPVAPTLSINRPAGTVTGDVMMASVTVNPSTVTITPPVGWSLIRETVQGSATTSRLATYYRVAGVGEPASYAWSFSASHAGAAGGIASFSGVDNVTPFDAEAGSATASALTHVAPTVTTTLSNGMLLTTHAYASSGTWAPPGGMTEAVDVASLTPNNANGITLEMNYEVRPTAGATGTRTATASANADRGATQSISLKPLPLICYTDNFNRANGPPGPDWDASFVSGSFGSPVIFNNRLRMTNASGGAATRATLQRLFPAAGNRIEVEFDDFAYGGSGADGIAVIFSDSLVTPVAGAFGGSLGYAQKSNPGSDCTVPGGCPGFAGGWLGIGIDEYGNFSNPSEGRSGGPGQRPDAVTTRGSGSGMTGYLYHTTTGTLAPGIDQAGATPAPGYRYRVIIDHSNSTNALVSVERDTGSGYTTLIAPYDAKAQAGQANVPTSWLLSYTGSTGGATNIHEIDNLSICAATQTPISGIHHFDITAAPSASTCGAQSVTVVAKNAAGDTITSYTGSVTITTSSAHGDWGLPAANGAADDGAATYTFTTANNGSITLSLTNTHADDLTVNVTDVAVPATSSTSATISFRDSAFVITPDPIQVAGRNQNMTVRLVTGNSCATDTGYTGPKNLDAWLVLDPADPGGTVPTINGVSLPTTMPAPNPGSNNLSGAAALNFVNGVASFAMATTDVGRYLLNLRDDTRLYANAVDLGGASSSITTRPFGLGITQIKKGATANPGGTASAGTKFIVAADTFEATVAAYLWSGADDNNVPGGDGVPDTGADITDNSVIARFAWATTLSASTTAGDFTPVGGAVGLLAGSVAIPQASFSGGASTVTDLTYSEVGSMKLRALAQNYLNSAGVNVSGTSPVVGRFAPAHFTLTAGSITPACGTFTYMGQPGIGISYSLEARNLSNAKTNNYSVPAGYTLVTPVGLQIENNDDGISLTARLTGAPSATWTVGAYAPSGAGAMFNRAATPDGAFDTLLFGLAVADADGAVIQSQNMNPSTAGDCTVTSSCTARSFATTSVRFGRLFLRNVYGPELLPLPSPITAAPVVMQAEYYAGAASGFVLNTSDNCTSVGLGSLSLSNTFLPSPVAGTAPKIVKGVVTTTASIANSPFASGNGGLSFGAPGAGGDGYVDVTIGAGQLPAHLQFDWDNDGVHDNNPSARATFGIYRGSPRNIYLRERY